MVISRLQKSVIFVLLGTLLAIQPIQPLSTTKKVLLVGSIAIACAGLYYAYKQSKKKYEENKADNQSNHNEESNDKDLTSSFVVGLAAAGLFSGGLFCSSPKDSQESLKPKAPPTVTRTQFASLDLSQPTPGYHNFGTSCFMNTVLQCEFNSPKVREALSKRIEQPDMLDAEKQLIALFYDSLSKNVYSLFPTNIHNFIRSKYFPGQGFSVHQDSQELLLRLIDDSKISNLYTIIQREDVTCPHCNDVSGTRRGDSMLRLNLPGNSNEVVSLIDLIHNNEEQETTIAGCCFCDEAAEKATKRVTVISQPERLIIHLARFVAEKRVFPGEKNAEFVAKKITTPVAFPLEQDFFGGDVCYRLQSFHVHMGQGIHGGHYIAYIKHPSKDQWFLYNDEKRSEVPQAAIQDILDRGAVSEGSVPYILCYEKI